MENHPAKHFALQLGSLASLYLSLSFFLVLLFGLINIQFPDAIENVWDIQSASSSVRLGFAMVIVFFPAYLVLTRLVNKNRRKGGSSSYLGLTRWLIYLSLLIGGAVLLGDLVAVIMGFLEGELTTRFILKALAVFLITGLATYYYVLDARGYWLQHEKTSKMYAGATTALVLIVLGLSLTYIQTPSEVREARVDTQILGDLQDMQWRIEDYYRTNQALPADLGELYGEFAVPTPPGDLPPYEYVVTGEKTYRFCATFNQDTPGRVTTERLSLAPTAIKGNSNWDYKAGYWCFERVIDEEYRL